VAEIMASHFGTGPDDELVRLIGDRTGGNPFFVLEVLRLLASNGWPGRTVSEAASLLAQQVPAGVRDVLRRRLARLPEQTRAVLVVAAVNGYDFDLDIVGAVTGVDDEEALAAVELTVSAGLVVENPATVGRFRFAHALIREAFYGEISRARRARLHARVGQALLDKHGGDPEHILQLAHHWWLAAPVVGAEQAVPHVIAAADRCLDTLAHEEAERHLRRGLDLLASTPLSASRSASELALHLRLGTLLVGVQLRLGRQLGRPRDSAHEQAWASFTRARQLADELRDSSAALAAYRGLFEVAFAKADHRAATSLAQVMLDAAGRSGDQAGLVVARLALGRTLWSQGRLTAAREHLERGLQLATGTSERRELLPPTVSLRLQLAAVLDLLGEPESAAALVNAAVETSPDTHPFARAAVLTGAALMAALRRDVSDARRWATATLDLTARWTATPPSGYAAVVLGWVDALEGGSEAAIPDLRRHLDHIGAGGAQHLLAWGLGLLAEAFLCNHQPDQALRLLDDALSRVESTAERLYESELHRLRGLSLAALDPPRPEQAHGALQKAFAVARQQGSALLQQRALDTSPAVSLDVHSGSLNQAESQP
jgi:tetratricopeptide (TPR) repeat protein